MSWFELCCWLPSITLHTAQAKMNAEYPCPHSSAALMTTMAAIQATVFTLCVERDWNQWKLGFNIRLLTVAYAVCSIHRNFYVQYHHALDFEINYMHR